MHAGNNFLASVTALFKVYTSNVSDIKIPVMHLAAKEDHIAPPDSVFYGCSFFGGPTEYVMSGSGHIAGVVNPPAAGKYQYWTGERSEQDFETWKENATETAGSWWPYWHKWIENNNDKKVDARKPGDQKLTTIEAAPGSYVSATIPVKT